MNKTKVKDKIINLEAEIGLLKKAVASQPDFDIDETNWKKIRPTVKRARAKIYKQNYG